MTLHGVPEPDWIIGAWVEREAYIAGIGVLCFLHTVLRKRKNFLCNITISVKSEFVVVFIKTSKNVDFSMFKWISVYPLNEINSRFLNGQMSFY